MSDEKGMPIRLLARAADQACGAEDADAETKKYCEEEIGLTPLHSDAYEGKTEKVKELLDKGADVNATDKLGWTPLHDATIQGHADIVRLLLAAGADPNAQDPEDMYTPLHDAARMDFPEIVTLLLAAGADKNLLDVAGQTARQIAEEYGYKEVVALL